MAGKVKASAISEPIPVNGWDLETVADLESAISSAMHITKQKGHLVYTWWGNDVTARKARIKLEILDPLQRIIDCIVAFQSGEKVKVPIKQLKKVDKPKKGV